MKHAEELEKRHGELMKSEAEMSKKFESTRAQLEAYQQ